MGDIELGRRAVKAAGWRWVDGMRYRLNVGHPWQRYEGSDAHDVLGCAVVEAAPSARSPFAEPDLTDAATLGAVLALVREAWRDASISTRCRARLGDGGRLTTGPWDCVSQSEHVSISVHGTLADSEAGSLVLALEAAPVRS